jgi:DNA-binding transcriptional LysR family regulator
MISMVQLRHMVSLSETGSFSRSAAACFVTQSAMSRSIRALEEELGQPLFDRVGHRAELTTFGGEVLARARGILFDTEELRAIGPKARDARLGRLSLGVSGGAAELLAAPLLLHMARHYPRLRVVLAHGDAKLLSKGLRSRELDALVIELRLIEPAADLSTEPLAELKGAFMCRHGHPLLRRRGPVCFADLLPYPFVSTPLGDRITRTLVERYGPAALPAACVTHRSEDIGSLAEVARQSDAVLLAVRATAPALAELVLTPALAASAQFGMVTLTRRSEAPALPAARRFIEQELRRQAVVGYAKAPVGRKRSAPK